MPIVNSPLECKLSRMCPLGGTKCVYIFLFGFKVNFKNNL